MPKFIPFISRTGKARQDQQPESAVVIGAGVAGLATAALLAKDGLRVTVVEKTEATGGRAGMLSEDGFRWDTGPSWYLMPEAYDHFFELMGTTTAEQYELTDLSPAYRLYPEGMDPVDVETGRDAVAQLFESIEPGAGEKILAYLDKATDAYATSIDHFLYTTFSDPSNLLHGDIRSRLRHLGTLLTKNLQDYVAAQFKDHRLRQLLTYPAVFLSTQPAKAPALYSLMSHTDLVEGVRYPQGGFAAVIAAIEKLAREAGVEILTGTEVTAILTEKGAATGVRTTGAGTGSQPGEHADIHADIVVSAADLHHTETALLPPALRTYPESYWAKRDPGLGTVLVLLGVRGKLPQLSHHTLLFSRDWEPDFTAVYEGPEPQRPLGASRSIYVSKTSASEASVAPEGHENLFILVPVPPDEGLSQVRVEAIADAAVDQLAARTGIPDLHERIVARRTLGPADFARNYHAWCGGAIGPAHTLAQSAFLRGSNQSSKVKGLYYAGGTTVPGVGVPMCLISAENVLKRIHGDTSPGPLHTVPWEGK